MKRLLTFLTSLPIIVVIVTTLCSCENQEPGPSPDTLWDFGGYDVEIKIADKSGTNLLNPTIEGGWMRHSEWFTMVKNMKRNGTSTKMA